MVAVVDPPINMEIIFEKSLDKSMIYGIIYVTNFVVTGFIWNLYCGTAMKCDITFHVISETAFFISESSAEIHNINRKENRHV